MVVFMLSPDSSLDQLYISNYALLQVRDQLLRLDGIGDITIFGARDYSMRLWLDPDKISNLGMTASDVVAAIRAQNLQITGGQLASPPIADRAFQPNLTFVGRLKDPSQFEDIVVKSGQDGRIVRLRDVARIELGALDYSTNSLLLRKSAVALRVTQRPGSNALATAKGIKDTMEKLKAGFPKGLDYNIGYNPTEFIAQSIHELIKTIYEAMLLVVIVVLVFLQGWRPAIIPIAAIPVSLVGTFAAMAALGSQILVPHEEKRPPAAWNLIGRAWELFTGIFSRGFDRLSHVYASLADLVIRHRVAMLLVYVALIGSAGWLLVTTPQGYIPAQDRGYVIISAQLPGAPSLARTTEIVRRIESTALDTPGIVRVAAFAGLPGATRTEASNSAALFPVFEEPEVRLKKGLTAAVITADLRKRLSAIQGAFIIVIPAPPIPGIGTGGGFTMRVQDRQGRGPELLAAATNELVNAARKTPGLTSVFSPFSANTPQVFVDIDRVKAQKLGVAIQDLTDTIETDFG